MDYVLGARLCLLEVMVLERKDINKLIGSDQKQPGGSIRKAVSLEDMSPQGVVESSVQGIHHSVRGPQGLPQSEEWG